MQSWVAKADRASAAMLWVAACWCFFGFLRSSEVVVPSELAFHLQSHLWFEDVAMESTCPVLYPGDPEDVQNRSILGRALPSPLGAQVLTCA